MCLSTNPAKKTLRDISLGFVGQWHEIDELAAKLKIRFAMVQVLEW